MRKEQKQAIAQRKSRKTFQAHKTCTSGGHLLSIENTRCEQGTRRTLTCAATQKSPIMINPTWHESKSCMFLVLATIGPGKCGDIVRQPHDRILSSLRTQSIHMNRFYKISENKKQVILVPSTVVADFWRLLHNEKVTFKAAHTILQHLVRIFAGTGTCGALDGNVGLALSISKVSSTSAASKTMRYPFPFLNT